LKIALSALDGGRIGIAAAKRLDWRKARSTIPLSSRNPRRAFGKNIGEFQAIQWMLADMQTEIEAAARLDALRRVAERFGKSHGSSSGRSEKFTPSEMANRVAYKACADSWQPRLFARTDVERMYRDARVITFNEGPSEVQRMIIARDLLK